MSATFKGSVQDGFEHCGFFREGDQVPEWLLQRTPHSDKAVHGEFCFECDSHVVKAFGGYFIVASHLTAGTLRIQDAEHVTVGAASLSVHIPIMWQVFR